MEVASSWADCFDIILEAYQRLAENLPLFTEYQSLFGHNSRMASVLALIYEDILEFHQVALRVLKRPSKDPKLSFKYLYLQCSAWKQMFRAAWKDFESKFQHLVDDLRIHKDLIESHASILQIQETQVERAHMRRQFAMIEQSQRQKKHLDVVTWLSAVNPILDHEAAISVRQSHPSSGRWLLQDSKMKAWLDHSRSSVPLLWMNGIPGAGTP